MSKSKQDTGIDSATLNASGALGESSHPESSRGIQGSEKEGMFPIGSEQIDLSFGSNEQTLPKSDLSSMFGSVIEAGKMFYEDVTKFCEKVVDQYFTPHAKGDQGMDLKTLGQGERVTPPTASEAHAKIHGPRGADEGRGG